MARSLAVMCQEMKKRSYRDKEEEKCEQADMDVNNEGFRLLHNAASGQKLHRVPLRKTFSVA